MDELSSKQFLLCSHRLIQNGDAAMEKFNKYATGDRSILIHDESLMTTDALSLPFKSLEAGVDWLRREVTYGGRRKEHLGPVWRYTKECFGQ